MKYLLLAGFFLVATDVCVAAGDTSPRAILSMGCHLGDTTCFAQLDGPPFGPAACSSTTIRWSTADSPGGKAQLALLTAAFVSNKKVNFYWPDTCYAPQPSYPTFVYSIVVPGQ